MLPAQCKQRLAAAELILHAGDLSTVAVLDELAALGPPVLAVAGNVDEPALQARLPQQREIELAGVRIAMIHDAGPAKGRLEALSARFPDADAVIFGHSHIPLSESRGGLQIFNPGSPTDRRRQPHHTMGLAHIREGTVRFELVTLPNP